MCNDDWNKSRDLFTIVRTMDKTANEINSLDALVAVSSMCYTSHVVILDACSLASVAYEISSWFYPEKMLKLFFQATCLGSMRRHGDEIKFLLRRIWKVLYRCHVMRNLSWATWSGAIFNLNLVLIRRFAD